MRCAFRSTLLLALVLISALVAQPADAEPLVVDQAVFSPAGSSVGQVVHLPHAWPDRLQGQSFRSARYELHFDTGTATPDPSQLWALSVRRMSTRYRISVNGRLVAVDEAGIADQSPQHVHPVFADIPPALLRSGDNLLQLEIEAEQGQGRGLAPLRLGPRDDVLADEARYEAFHLQLPQTINAATVPFALALLAMWAVRRRESAAALFALAWLPTAIRNHGVYVAAAPIVSDWARVSIVASRVGSSILLALFAISLSRQTWPRLRRFCLGSLIALLLVLLLADGMGRLADWRQALYGVSLPYLGLALVLLWQRARSEGPVLFAVIASIGSLQAAAGVHDLLLVQGRLGIEAWEWLPWISPVVFVTVALWMLIRAAKALDEVQALNLQLEHRVNERTSDLRAAVAAKSRFLAAASHDLRQPLHAISMLTAVLSRRASTPEIAAVSQRLDESVSGMQAMLDALLDVSNLDSSAEAPRFEAVSLALAFGRVAQDMGPLAIERGLDLRVRPTGIWVRSDAAMLYRIIQNLVANAIRYTPNGGVLIGARKRGEMACIEIWDTGVGIAAEQHDAIFDEYVQLSNPARDRRKGVGLGLAIVRRIAEKLGTSVTLMSRVGRGSVFRFSVPRVAVPMGLAKFGSHDRVGANARMTEMDASGLFVLIVDDDEAIRHSMTALLSELGCQVVTAASGHAVPEVLARHLRPPDAAIVDYRLVGETGIQAIARLRSALDPNLPVALVSGDVAQLQQWRIDRPDIVVMSKPLILARLLEWLAQVKRGWSRDPAR